MTTAERKKLEDEARKKREALYRDIRKQKEAEARLAQTPLAKRESIASPEAAAERLGAKAANQAVTERLQAQEQERQDKIKREREEQAKYAAKPKLSVTEEMQQRVVPPGTTVKPTAASKTPAVADINRAAANVDYSWERRQARENYAVNEDLTPLQRFERSAQKYNPLAIGDMMINQTGVGAYRMGADLAAAGDKVKEYIDNAKTLRNRYATDSAYKHQNILPSVQDKADEYSAQMAEKYADLTDNDVTKALSDLAGSTGYMIPAMLSNYILPNSGTALLFTSGYTSGERQALKEGATQGEAKAYALLNGLNQSIGEMLIGGVGGAGKGLLNKVFADTNISLIDKITNPRLKALAQLGMRSLGEGVEEVVQGIADTGFRKLTYEPDAKLDPAGLAYEGLLGFGMGLTFGAPQFARDLQTPRIAAQAQTNDYYNQFIENIRAQENDLHGRLRTVDEDAIYERLTSAKNNTEKSGILAGASDETIAAASRTAEAGKVDILFFNEGRTESGNIVDGYELGGKLYVNSQSPRAVEFILGHEFTHAIEKAKSYDKLSRYVLNRMGTDAVAAERQRIGGIRTAEGQRLTEAEIDREIVADFAGKNLLNNEADIVDIVRADRTLAEKIRDWLSGMIKRFTGTADERFYSRARSLYIKALAEARRSDAVTGKAAASVSSAEVTNDISNIPEVDSKGRQLSAWQRNRFGQSKALAKDKTLLTLYHGSSKEFSVFSHEKSGGLFNLTSEQGAAAMYAQGGGGGRDTGGIKDQYIYDIDSGDAYDYNEDTGEWEYYGNVYDGDNANSLSFSTIKKSDPPEGYEKPNQFEITSSNEYSSFRTVPKESNVMEVYADMKNPLDLRSDHVGFSEIQQPGSKEKRAEAYKVFKDMWDNKFKDMVMPAEDGKNVSRLFSQIFSSYKSDGDFYHFWTRTKYEWAMRVFEKYIVPELKTRGIDGLIYDDDGHETYAVFDPEQIKDVNNKNPTDNPDIRYSVSKADDTAYLDAVNRGDTEAAQKMVDEAAERSGLPILDDSASTSYRVRRTPPPQKTAKAYKLFATKKTRPGELFPLFVGADTSVPQDVWLDAIAGQAAPDSKTGRKKVKSKLGPLAYRPGWHSGDVPYASHIGVKDADGNIWARKDNEVWAEVEVAADVNYQPEADANGRKPDGNISVPLADIKHMPDNGMYRYKTNPNMTGTWIISGSMKINRVLTEQEVNDILAKKNIKPMPWNSGKLDLSTMGLTPGAAKNNYKLLDAVTYDNNGNIIPLSQRFNKENPDIRYSVSNDYFRKRADATKAINATTQDADTWQAPPKTRRAVPIEATITADERAGDLYKKALAESKRADVAAEAVKASVSESGKFNPNNAKRSKYGIDWDNVYDRWSNDSPMSRAGYAMFAQGDPVNRGSRFGDTLYTYYGENSVWAGDLNDVIADKWDEMLSNSDERHFMSEEKDMLARTYSTDDVVQAFNPRDIVDSAEAYDDEKWVAWLWDEVLEPMGVDAVTTNNGAVVFDESIIKKAQGVTQRDADNDYLQYNATNPDIRYSVSNDYFRKRADATKAINATTQDADTWQAPPKTRRAVPIEATITADERAGEAALTAHKTLQQIIDEIDSRYEQQAEIATQQAREHLDRIIEQENAKHIEIPGVPVSETAEAEAAEARELTLPYVMADEDAKDNVKKVSAEENQSIALITEAEALLKPADPLQADMEAYKKAKKDYRATVQGNKTNPGMVTDADVLASAEQVSKARDNVLKKIEKREAAMKHALDNGTFAEVMLKQYEQLKQMKKAARNTKNPEAQAKAQKQAEQKQAYIFDINRRRKALLYKQAEETMGPLEAWTDKSIGLKYQRETFERNIRDIAPNKTIAERVNKEYRWVIDKNEAKRNKYRQDYNERVKALNMSDKVLPGNEVSERYAVQFVGEADYLIYISTAKKDRFAKTRADYQQDLNDFMAKNPNFNYEAIREKVKTMRGIYNAIYIDINKARVENGYEPVEYRKGYFPHFSEHKPDTLLSKLAATFGINTAPDSLPTSINGLTYQFRPGTRWFGNILRRSSNTTDYDAVKGFDRYILGASDVIFHTEDIQRLRAMSNYIREYGSDKRLQDQAKLIRADDTKTAEQQQEAIASLFREANHVLGNFVVDLDEYTNQLANKKPRKDRDTEYDFGRKAYNILQSVENRIASNMVAVNPRTWLTNFIPIHQAAARISNKNMIYGALSAVKATIESDALSDASDFLVNRRGVDPLVMSFSQKAGDVLSKPMTWIDNYAAETIVRARYLDNMEKGMPHANAIDEAGAFATGIMAGRSKGAAPTLFSAKNPATKVFTMFQLEVNNELSALLKDLPDEKRDEGVAALAMAFIKFIVGAYLFNDLFEWIIGARPGLDVAGVANEAVGDFTGYQLPNTFEFAADLIKERRLPELADFETTKKTTNAAGISTAKNIAEELPFIGGVLGGGRVPISAAGFDLGKIWSAGSGIKDGTVDSNKALATIGKELSNPLFYLALPFGGGQIKKIYQGVDAVNQGGSWTLDSDGDRVLQYPVFDKNPLTYARAALFGKTSLPTAQDWIDNDFKRLSASASATYAALTNMKQDPEEAYNAVMDIAKSEKTDTQSKASIQRNKIAGYPIAGSMKYEMYYNMVASDSDKRIMDELTKANLNEGAAFSVIDKYKDLNESKAKAGEKALDWQHWVDKQGFTDKQKSIIDENIGFRVAMPVEPSTYEKLTASGMEADAAYQIAEAFNKLKPLEGETGVSEYQKYHAINEMDLEQKVKLAAYRAIMEKERYMKLADAVIAGTPLKLYIEYIDKVRGIKSDLQDGETVPGSKKQKVLSYINFLPITKKAKDKLYEQAGYSESTISDAPWRGGAKYSGDMFGLKVNGRQLG